MYGCVTSFVFVTTCVPKCFRSCSTAHHDLVSTAVSLLKGWLCVEESSIEKYVSICSHFVIRRSIGVTCGTVFSVE